MSKYNHRSATCIATRRRCLQAFALSLLFWLTASALAQPPATISAGNIARLRPAARIDFADFPAPPNIGFFAANDAASKFIVFDQEGRLYTVDAAGMQNSLIYREAAADSVFTVIDALYTAAGPRVLYHLDGLYYINDSPLPPPHSPVALFKGEAAGQLVIEALDAAGSTVFLLYNLESGPGPARLLAEIAFPAPAGAAPLLRIGRIAFPLVILASLDDGSLQVYRYPTAFVAGQGHRYRLPDGPAVFGALNSPAASHFFWGGPASQGLNLLELASGENKIVAEIGGAYAQHYLLTADASAIILVHVDSQPAVFAWTVAEGQRHDLGAYRSCQRIPDKVALSADGTALIIGCDSGLHIWRVAAEEGKNE